MNGKPPRVADLIKAADVPTHTRGKLPFHGSVTIIPRGQSKPRRTKSFTGKSGFLIFGRRQKHLVLLCSDGKRRSFGEGSRIQF